MCCQRLSVSLDNTAARSMPLSALQSFRLFLVIRWFQPRFANLEIRLWVFSRLITVQFLFLSQFLVPFRIHLLSQFTESASFLWLFQPEFHSLSQHLFPMMYQPNQIIKQLKPFSHSPLCCPLDIWTKHNPRIRTDLILNRETSAFRHRMATRCWIEQC